MLCLLGGAFALSGLCSYAYARIMVHIAQNTVAAIRRDLFNKMQSLPLRYFDGHAYGDADRNTDGYPDGHAHGDADRISDAYADSDAHPGSLSS